MEHESRGPRHIFWKVLGQIKKVQGFTICFALQGMEEASSSEFPAADMQGVVVNNRTFDEILDHFAQDLCDRRIVLGWVLAPNDLFKLIFTFTKLPNFDKVQWNLLHVCIALHNCYLLCSYGKVMNLLQEPNCKGVGAYPTGINFSAFGDGSFACWQQHATFGRGTAVRESRPWASGLFCKAYNTDSKLQV